MFYLTLSQAEAALDAGDIKWLSPRHTWWECRRNGKTKLWKTRPDDYCIPVKCGFNAYDYITQQSLFCQPGDGPMTDFQLVSMCLPNGVHNAPRHAVSL